MIKSIAALAAFVGLLIAVCGSTHGNPGTLSRKILNEGKAAGPHHIVVVELTEKAAEHAVEILITGNIKSSGGMHVHTAEGGMRLKSLTITEPTKTDKGEPVPGVFHLSTLLRCQVRGFYFYTDGESRIDVVEGKSWIRSIRYERVSH